MPDYELVSASDPKKYYRCSLQE